MTHALILMVAVEQIDEEAMVLSSNGETRFSGTKAIYVFNLINN